MSDSACGAQTHRQAACHHCRYNAVYSAPVRHAASLLCVLLFCPSQAHFEQHGVNLTHQQEKLDLLATLGLDLYITGERVGCLHCAFLLSRLLVVTGTLHHAVEGGNMGNRAGACLLADYGCHGAASCWVRANQLMASCLRL